MILIFTLMIPVILMPESSWNSWIRLVCLNILPPLRMFLDIYSILSSHGRLMTLMYSLRSRHATFLIVALLNVNYLSLVLICWSMKFLIGSSNRLIWIILDGTLHHLFFAIHSGQASKNWLSDMIPLCHKSWINKPP